MNDIIEQDAKTVFDATQNTAADSIAALADETGLDPKYVRQILVTLDKRGLVGFQPDSATQVIGYHWDEDTDGIFENLWQQGDVETQVITLAAPTGTCRCGCGSNVAGKRQYRPGHDARHASQVAKQVIAGGDESLIQSLPTPALQAKAKAQVLRAQHRAEAKAKRAAARGDAAPKTVPNVKGSALTEAMIEAMVTEGTVKIGRWTYPARREGNDTQRNVKRDGSGAWVPVSDAVEFVAN